MLVWPGQSTMTLLPSAPVAARMPPPNPSPKASSSTRETTPQLMPSIVSAERMRFRSSAVQLCWINSLRYTLHLGSFVAQTLDWIHVSGALRGIHPCTHGDNRQSQQRAHDGNGRNYRLGHKVGEGRSRQQQTKPNSHHVAESSAEHGQRHRFAEELFQDVGLGGAHGSQDANLARTLGDRHQHDVHYADPAQAERGEGNASEENC